jgi:hypothetical protein
MEPIVKSIQIIFCLKISIQDGLKQRHFNAIAFQLCLNAPLSRSKKTRENEADWETSASDDENLYGDNINIA